MTAGPCPPAERLGAFLAGALDDPDSAVVAEHLDTCPACRTASDALDAALAGAYRRAARAAPPAEAPARIGEYEILGEIGRGGMGVVYRAFHPPLRRTVALKVLRAGAVAGADERHRFRAEAVAVAKLQHPNVVQVFDTGEWHPSAGAVPLPYLAFELVAGGNLAARAAGRPQDPRQVGRWVAALARAAHHAHEAGIVHRDLKPSNVLLDRDDQPKLCDFGIAKSADGSVHTESGAIVGTAGYLAPEQIDRALGAVGPRTDVYGLGVVLYELLTGRLPFTGELAAVLAAIRTDAPVRPGAQRPGVPRALDAICLKCLQKATDDRYATAAELADDLDRFLGGQPVRPRLPGLARRARRWARRRAATVAVALAVLCAAVALGAWAARRPDPPAPPEDAWPGEGPPAPVAAAPQQPPQSFPDYLALLERAEKAWRLGEPLDRVLALLDECAPEHRHWEWFHLRAKFAPPDHTFTGHAGDVTAVCYSPDGARVASGAADGAVRVLDSRTGAELFALMADAPVRCLAFAPDGKRLFAGVQGKAGAVWNLDTRQRRAVRPPFSPETGLAPTHDGRLAWAAPGRAYGLDLATETNALDLPLGNTEGRPVFLAAHPSADRLVTAQGDKLTLWETATQKQIASRAFRQEAVAAAYHPGGGQFAVLGRTGFVGLYDGASGAEAGNAGTDTGTKSLRQLVYSPNGRLFAGVAEDGFAHLWSSDPGEAGSHPPPLTLRGPAGAGRAVAYHPGGGQLAVGVGRTVALWNLTTSRPLRQLHLAPSELVMALGISPNGDALAAVTDGVLRLWDWTGAPTAEFEHAPLGLVRSVAWSPDGRWVAATGNQGGQVWDARTRKRAWSLPDGASTVTFSPAGELVAAVGAKGVAVRKAATGEQVLALNGDRTVGDPASFSPDGRLIATFVKGAVRVSAVPSGEEVYTLPAKGATALAFSPDGKYLAWTSDRNVVLSDARTGHPVRTLLADGLATIRLCFSPDGRRLACGTGDPLIRIWNPHTGSVLQLLKAYNGTGRIDWGADGRRLVAGTMSVGEVLAWDAPGFAIERP